MGLKRFDASLSTTKALPNGAATVKSSAFDLKLGSKGDLLSDVEVRIEAPALVVGDLADTKTMTYDVIHGDAADLSDSAVLLGAVLVQTGAGGAGAGAANVQMRLPVDVKRYVGVQATNNAAGDASDKSMTVKLAF